MTTQHEKDRLTMTVEEAAELLGIGRNLGYELARTGKLPVLRLGRRMVVPRAGLERMLAGQSLEAEEDPAPAQPPLRLVGKR